MVSAETFWPIVAADANQRAILRASGQHDDDVTPLRRRTQLQSLAPSHQRSPQQTEQLRRVQAAQNELRALEERRLQIAKQQAIARKHEAEIAMKSRRRQSAGARGKKKDSAFGGPALGASSKSSAVIPSSIPTRVTPPRRFSRKKQPDKSVREKVVEQERQRREAAEKALQEKEERRQRQRQYSKAVTELFKPSVDQTKVEEVKARRDVPRLPRTGVFGANTDDPYEAPRDIAANAAQQRHMLRDLFKDRADAAERGRVKRERERRLEEANRLRPTGGGWGQPHVPPRRIAPEPADHRLVVRLPAVPPVTSSRVRQASAPPVRSSPRGAPSSLPKLDPSSTSSNRTASRLVEEGSGGELLEKARRLESMARRKEQAGGESSALEQSLYDGGRGADVDEADALYMQAIEAKLAALTSG